MYRKIGNRKNGISLLVPTQNAERTVEMCIKSFYEFADEIIVVDNGSNDGTIDIVQELQKDDKIQFYNVPELKDLYQNRQFAFSKSKYNWIVRIDSDYVAYTSGELNIVNLRKKILNTKQKLRPVAFGITQVNLIYDFYHTGIPREERTSGGGPNIDSPITQLPARIIQYFPGMEFKRLGRWEGVKYQKYLKHIQIEEPYWFHCQLKRDMDLFYRSERTNWRELGDFKKYPTLDSYIKNHVVPVKYGSKNLIDACNIYMEKDYHPYLHKYTPNLYYEYPEMIAKSLEK